MTTRPLYPTVRKYRGIPRITRKALRQDRYGQTKIVRDYDELIDLERVVPQSPRLCAARERCSRAGMIRPERDPAYFRLTYLRGHAPEGALPHRAAKHMPSYWRAPVTEGYHDLCLPEFARPALRLLFRGRA